REDRQRHRRNAERAVARRHVDRAPDGNADARARPHRAVRLPCQPPRELAEPHGRHRRCLPAGDVEVRRGWRRHLRRAGQAAEELGQGRLKARLGQLMLARRRRSRDDEASLFVIGRATELYTKSRLEPPPWAWVNALAHGSWSELTRLTSMPPQEP